MDLYKCLSDAQRIRILGILSQGPLCVCHLIEILQADSIKMSKQLRYMKELGVLQVERDANWKIYSLTEEAQPLIEANITCLLEADRTLGVDLRRDARQRVSILKRLQREETKAPVIIKEMAEACC